MSASMQQALKILPNYLYRIINRGEMDPDVGVPGKSDGDPAREYSKECE